MDAETPDRTSRSLSLGKRLVLSTGLLVTLAIAAAVFVTWFRGRMIAEDSVRDQLRRSSSIQLAFEEQRLGQLDLIARMIAGDTYFAEYVRLAIEEGDALSILDQLDERRNDLDFDFAMVLDPDGLVVARTDAPQAGAEDLAGDPLVSQALEELEAAGVWTRDGTLYDVVAVPVASAGYLDGFLMVGYALDDEMALQQRRVSETHVAFVVTGAEGPRTSAGTLEPRAAEALQRALRERPDLMTRASGEVDQVVTTPIELEGHQWMAAIRHLEGADGSLLGVVVALGDLEQALRPFRKIQAVLGFVGLGVLLLSLGVSAFLPRGVLGPIRSLAAAARSAAQGNYDQHIEPGGSDEVGQLSGAFSSLLADLREKRDMETYITELARTMPDQEAESAPAAKSSTSEPKPPLTRHLVLLGAELRGVAHQDAPAEQTLLHLARDLSPITQAILESGGHIEQMLGHRLIASFDGPDRGRRALAAAAAITESTSNTSNQEKGTAIVLVAGNTTSGALVLDKEPESALAGPPVEQLESLLRVARLDAVLISQAVRSEVDQTLSLTGTSAREVRSSISPEPLYTLQTTQLAPLKTGQIPATMDLSGDTMVASGHQPPPLPSATRAPTVVTAAVSRATLSNIGPGRVLGNRFEILSILGAGGMGVVYKARDRSLQELVALKMLRQDVWDDADRLQKLKDELKLARKIAHANVLRTYDFGEVDGTTFITMEYVRGITLKKMLHESGRLPLSAGLRLSRQLCQGLSAAHREHVIHRDIKPENLILEHTGNVKLMDFGIATPIQRGAAKETGAEIVGTPHYIAPEQLEGREADVRSDIYAAGVVFYEIFTGQLPYDFGKTLQEILTMKMREKPIRPSERWADIPPRLEALLLRCLARDPKERHASTLDLLRDFDTLRG